MLWVNSALEGMVGGVGGMDAKEGARLKTEVEEMKGTINSLAARMQQVRTA